MSPDPHHHPSHRGFSRLPVALAAALALAIFLVDVFQPITGQAWGMAYVLVILMGLWIDVPAYPILAALVVTALVIADLAIDWTGDIPAPVFVNQPLMTLLFWIAAALVMRFKRLEVNSRTHVKALADLKDALDRSAIVATTDVSGKITYVNDKFCEISKYSREELLGQDHRIINSGLHSKEFIRDLWQTIARGGVWHGELRNRARDGAFYWVDTTIVPFLDGSGKPYQYIAIRSDITERKSAEERLRYQAALARVGQLAAMVAHEVKNPLAGIKGALQVLMSRRPPGDAEAAVMHEIIDRVDALNELITDLLVFSRPRPPRLQPIEMRPLLMEALGMMRKDPIGEHIGTEIEGPDIAITGDSALLKAVFTNLFINAAQAMHGTGSVHIRMTQKKDGCRIEVQDGGPGVPKELREQIFEPFFTTKSRGGGLGLAIARRSVELHGGSLTLDCPPQGGTVVTAVLPLRPPEPAFGPE